MPADTMPERPALATPPAGAGTARRALPVIPGYEVRGVLGRGGMGVVYQARHLKLNRIVALKMILTGSYAGEQELARFHAEAAAVARLQHPNIVQIFDVGEHAEGGGPTHPFMALEYVPGGTLAQRVAASPLTPREAAAVLQTLGRAMHYAHQRGVVHRDLKPANVLLSADGTPKITDFGLAKTLDADGGQTQTGQVMGTPEYMAPEQAAGQVRDIGPATDVYALGTILYALLAGRPPFRAASLTETLDQVRHREPVPPGQVQAGLPRDLDTICLKCLQKEPRKRYASAEELAEDLRRFLAGEPIRARPVGRVERVVRWCRRYPLAASLLALLALFLAVAAGGWVTALRESDAKEFQRARAEDNGQKERDQRLKTEEALTNLGKQERQTAVERDNANGFLAIADLNAAMERRAKEEWMRETAFNQVLLAAQYEFNNNLPLADQTLDKVPPKLRGWEWRYLKRQCAGGVRVLSGHTSPVLTLAFGADGRRLLSSDQNRAARVWDTASGEQFGTPPFGFSALSMRPAGHVLRPDGRVLLVQMPFSGPQFTPEWEVARLRDLNTGKDICSLKAPNHTQVMRFVFSPDGKRVAGSVRVFKGG